MNILGIIIATIEWFNLATYFCFANAISKDILNPSLTNTVRLSVFSMMVAIINIGKPIGSYIFGKYSDKFSRIQTILFSFMLMFLCTIFTSFLPSYNKIGILSCILFMILNLIKGIATGGNYSATLYSIENSKYKYFTSSLITTGIFIGFHLTESVHPYIHWRTCLQIAAILSIPILIVIYKNTKNEIIKKETEEIKTTIQDYINACSLIILDVIPFYLLLSFLPNYRIIILKKDPNLIENSRKLTTLIIILLTPLIGSLSELINAKFFLKTSAIMLFLSSFFYFAPDFLITHQNLESVYYGIMFSLCYSTIYGYLPLKFKKSIRAKVCGVSLNLTATCINLIMPILTIYLNSNFYLINIIFAIVGTLTFFKI